MINSILHKVGQKAIHFSDDDFHLYSYPVYFL